MNDFANGIFCKLGDCSDCNSLASCTALSFALMAMVFGFLSVSIDFFTYKLIKLSYLSLRYVEGIATVFIFWTLGALVVGYLGAVVHIFDTTNIRSALFVSITWQVIFSKWIAGKFENEDIQPENAN